MRMVMVSIRDAKADLYMRPWFVQTEAVAIRAFSDEVNRVDKDNNLYNHTGDFALYQIGLFDDNDGKVYPFDVPKLLISADGVKNPKGTEDALAKIREARKFDAVQKS